jgi:hypothetical protein
MADGVPAALPVRHPYAFIPVRVALCLHIGQVLIYDAAKRGSLISREPLITGDLAFSKDL